MAQIGPFTLKDHIWSGTLRTLTLNVKARCVPGRDKENGAPDYRLFAGGAELGAAWRQDAKGSETPSGSMIRVLPGRCALPSSGTRKKAPASWSGTGPGNPIA